MAPYCAPLQTKRATLRGSIMVAFMASLHETMRIPLSVPCRRLGPAKLVGFWAILFQIAKDQQPMVRVGSHTFIASQFGVGTF